MKKILFFALLFSTVLYGANMGKKDMISKNLIVKNDYWSCSFIEGSMFPGDFVFADGSRAGAILFRDSAKQQNLEYQLFEERHAVQNIITDTKDEFIIECCGKYWRNISPLITAMKGVDVVCRYEFKRTEPAVKIIFKYKLQNAENVVFNKFCHIGWYYENPFAYAIADGKKLHLKRGLLHNNAKVISLENDDFKVELSSKDIVFEMPQKKSIISCALGIAGNKKINNNEFEIQAVLQLQKKR